MDITFTDTLYSVLLATSSDDTTCSYSTFVRVDDVFYILISDIAKHTKDINTTNKASMLFIEDECKAQNIFARQRISIQATTTKLTKDSDEYNHIKSIFFTKYDNDMVNKLLSLDFNIYALTPYKRSTYSGFGMAQSISTNKR